jgi:hypothetical protein
MPRGDGTGPMGMGPMTGRGAGFCTGFAAPGYVNPVGYGCGLGGGRGFRRMFYATGLRDGHVSKVRVQTEICIGC